MPQGSVVAGHVEKPSPPLLNMAGKRREMFPQGSGTWDSWKDTLMTYGPLADTQTPLCQLLPGQPATTPTPCHGKLVLLHCRCCIMLSPGTCRCPTVPCCWPPLLDVTDKRHEMVTGKVFVLGKPSAGPWQDKGRRGRSAPLWRGRGTLAPKEAFPFTWLRPIRMAGVFIAA